MIIMIMTTIISIITIIIIIMDGPHPCRGSGVALASVADPRTKILDFRGVDSSVILMLRGAILRSIGDFPEI